MDGKESVGFNFWRVIWDFWENQFNTVKILETRIQMFKGRGFRKEVDEVTSRYSSQRFVTRERKVICAVLSVLAWCL